MPIIDKVFLHFYDTHFLDEKLGEILPVHLQEIKYATLFSIIYSNVTYIPLASFIESDNCNSILKDYQDLFKYGIIEFIGNGANINEYLFNKKKQYPEDTFIGKKYRNFDFQSNGIPFKDKSGSTTEHIISEWNATLNNYNSFLKIFEKQYSPKAIDKLAKKWESVPLKLENKAFILSHIKPIFGKKINSNINILNSLHRIINSAYFNHFITTLNCGIISDMVFLEYPPLSVLTDKTIPYRYLLQTISTDKKYKSILDPNPQKLLLHRNSEIASDIYVKAMDMKKIDNENHYNEKKYFFMETREIVIGIVTALPKEHAAVKLMLIAPKLYNEKPASDPNDYFVGYINTKSNKKVKVILACQIEMGNNNASIVTVNMLRTFEEINEVLLVGIAGGVPFPSNPENHVRLGDIVCSSNILQYDNIKLESNDFTIRSNTSKPSATFTSKHRLLESGSFSNEYPWEEYIKQVSKDNNNFVKPDISTDILKINGKITNHPTDKNRRNGCPKVFFGKIGSANTLLKQEEKRDFLRDKHSVRAIEMESSGVADGVWTCNKSYFVVRGIVDYCNPDKSDSWQNYAALCAAAYAKSLIELF